MIRLLQSTIILQTTGYMLKFAAMVVFAKILGSEGQGILSIFRSTAQIIVAIIWFGLPASIIYFVGKDKRHYKLVLKNCLAWSFAVFLILVVSMFVLPIDRIPQINFLEKYTPFLLVFVFLLAFFILFHVLTLSLKNYLYYNLFTFGFGFAIFLGSVITNFTFRDSDRVTIAIACYIAGYAIMFFYGLSITLKEGFALSDQIWTPLRFVDQFRVGFRGYVSTLAALRLRLCFI